MEGRERGGSATEQEGGAARRGTARALQRALGVELSFSRVQRAGSKDRGLWRGSVFGEGSRALAWLHGLNRGRQSASLERRRGRFTPALHQLYTSFTPALHGREGEESRDAGLPGSGERARRGALYTSFTRARRRGVARTLHQLFAGGVGRARLRWGVWCGAGGAAVALRWRKGA